MKKRRTRRKKRADDQTFQDGRPFHALKRKIGFVKRIAAIAFKLLPKTGTRLGLKMLPQDASVSEPDDSITILCYLRVVGDHNDGPTFVV